jgi:hypothetical protein
MHIGIRRGRQGIRLWRHCGGRWLVGWGGGGVSVGEVTSRKRCSLLLAWMELDGGCLA